MKIEDKIIKKTLVSKENPNYQAFFYEIIIMTKMLLVPGTSNIFVILVNFVLNGRVAGFD
ncbi:hypothetical protein [Psychrobacillus sp. L3]|uniref:hypothetical protein n=1 Tax=Psychrobacillus sp. L3 TaxID=3236891 RepID=UPI0036F44767